MAMNLGRQVSLRVWRSVMKRTLSSFTCISRPNFASKRRSINRPSGHGPSCDGRSANTLPSGSRWSHRRRTPRAKRKRRSSGAMKLPTPDGVEAKGNPHARYAARWWYLNGHLDAQRSASQGPSRWSARPAAIMLHGQSPNACIVFDSEPAPIRFCLNPRQLPDLFDNASGKGEFRPPGQGVRGRTHKEHPVVGHEIDVVEGFANAGLLTWFGGHQYNPMAIFILHRNQRLLLTPWMRRKVFINKCESSLNLVTTCQEVKFTVKCALLSHRRGH